MAVEYYACEDCDTLMDKEPAQAEGYICPVDGGDLNPKPSYEIEEMLDETQYNHCFSCEAFFPRSETKKTHCLLCGKKTSGIV